MVVFLLVSWWLPVGRVGLFACGLLLVFVVCWFFLLWCLLFGGVGSVGFCLWVWLVLVAGRVLSGVFSSGAVCGSSLIFFGVFVWLVCCCGSWFCVGCFCYFRLPCE